MSSRTPEAPLGTGANLYSRVIAEVRESMNYDAFRHVKGNRAVMPGHVNKIVESITDAGMLLVPILVNGKGEIIDGQHRFEALKRLEMPIIYVVGKKYGIDEIKTLNTNQKNWSIMDYIKSWAEKGKKDYKDLVAFMEIYKFPINPSYAMLRGTGSTIGGDQRTTIKTGGFEIISKDKAIETAGLLETLIEDHEWLRKQEKFILSMLDIMNIEGFDFERMKFVIDNKADRLKYDLDSYHNCKVKLQELYNHRLSKEGRLRFWDEINQ